MRYLLDTHTFLWAMFSSNMLSKSSKAILTNNDNDILISVVSLWEISLKFNLNKLELTNILPDDLPGLARESGFNILHLDEHDAVTFYKLPKDLHKDPFDRLLIWQAIRNKISIISKDKSFKEYSKLGLNVLW